MHAESANNTLYQAEYHYKIIDDKLNFKIHINMVHTKISRSLYTLKQMKYLLDGRHLKLLFSSYLKSHIDYCDIFYCLCNTSTLNPFEMIY